MKTLLFTTDNIFTKLFPHVKIISSPISQKTPKGQKLAISIIYYAISFLSYLFFEKRRRIRRRGDDTN